MQSASELCNYVAKVIADANKECIGNIKKEYILKSLAVLKANGVIHNYNTYLDPEGMILKVQPCFPYWPQMLFSIKLS